MPVTDRDQLCVNTIRTLSMDAVQQANSGHPGTPMAMAPVAYALWQHHLRFDPDDPIWPDRDRFVLSMGHASMLLYSLLHLARREGREPQVRDAGRAVGDASTTSSAFGNSTAAARPSRVPLDLGHRDDDRTARTGRGHERRHGDRRASGWPRLSTVPTLRCSASASTRCAGDGCMMEGISSEAASMAGHLEARQPLLDLRQQQDHDRRAHGPGLQ